jgi:hypothetical protein
MIMEKIKKKKKKLVTAYFQYLHARTEEEQ